MEKLIMLIDIYEEEVVGVHSVGDKITDKEVARIISKQFGFIEWLVKNNKINFEKADADISKDIVLGREPDFADFMVYRRFLDEEKVLMLLSIQDEPVKFLSEILKDE